MDVTLLDGGMGQELIARSGKPAAPRWSLQVMLDNPGLVADVHKAYADVGATVATTNSYAIHRDRLRGADTNHYAGTGHHLPDIEHQFPELLETAVTEAQAVRSRSRVAGSIGPLGASYRSDLHPSVEDSIPLYAEIVKTLAPSVDLMLFETVASLTAAKACLAAGRQADKPVWLAFTVSDEDGTRLRSGEPLADAAEIAKGADAALVNCSIPEVIPAALDVLAAAGVPTGAYANGFEKIAQAFIDGGSTVEALSARQDLSPEAYAAHAMRWLDHGATIIGGCCEVGPAHIAELHRRLIEKGHKVV
ncbi:MAG: homocysteine S-methyltransferase family protein [Parvularculaceae bacterium]|nr:homocysteine S-methyltransferase family protein [Parvularculaceae bacterium]